MYLAIYNKKTNKIKNIISVIDTEKAIENLKNNGYISGEDGYKSFAQLSHTNIEDIRMIKENGNILTMEEQIAQKLIKLEKDEELIDGQIYKLDKNNQEDLLKLIELGIEKLDDSQKIVIDDEGNKYIAEKSMLEKLSENLISQDAYDSYVLSIRESQYSIKLDGKRAELLDDVLNNLSEQGLLNEEQNTKLEELKNIRAEIKEANPKSANALNDLKA